MNIEAKWYFMTTTADDGGDGKGMRTGMGFGLLLGAVIGLYMDNLALWIPVGIVFGAGLSKW